MPELKAPQLHDAWPKRCSVTNSGFLAFDGIAASDLIKQFGSPLVVFDEAEFVDSARSVRKAFAGFTVYYAAKSFLSGRVSQLVQQSGLSIDVCTGYELRLALDSGFTADAVLFHGNNKSRQELSDALHRGVRVFASDTFEEIRRLDEEAQALGIIDVSVFQGALRDVAR